MIERGGKIRVRHVSELDRDTVHGFIREGAQPKSNVYTDAHRAYSGLDSDYARDVVDDAEKYVDGCVHTNGLENFWSLLKRGFRGTYVSVQPFHPYRYLDERAFTVNARLGSSRPF